LKRAGLPRAGAVVQPYLTPRFAINGRNASGRRKAGGRCAKPVDSFGAIVREFVDSSQKKLANF